MVGRLGVGVPALAVAPADGKIKAAGYSKPVPIVPALES
jgi:hypothetical protein